MAYRRKTYKKKKRFGKKRAFKKTVKKVYRRRRSFKKKRVTRRSKPRVNQSLNVARFRIRVNRFNLALADDPQIIHIGNAADLTYTALSLNLPVLTNYNQWRIDNVVTHWKVKNNIRSDWRGDIVNHALIYKVPNDTAGPDGTLEPLQYNTDTVALNNFLTNYTQLVGVNVKKVSPWGGKIAYRPYVTEQITTLAKNTTAAPTTANDIRRNYSKIFRYASSAVRYEAPIFLVTPGLTKRRVQQTGTWGTNAVDTFIQNTEYPQLEVYSDIYVTVKQNRSFYSGEPAKLTVKSENPDINNINTDFNKIKQDVQHSVFDHITNSNPVIGAVAAMAGIRKRPRDEFKM